MQVCNSFAFNHQVSVCKANFLDSNVSVSVCFFVLICRIANVCIRACALIFLRDDFFVGVLLSHASVQMIKLKTSQ